MSKRNPNHKPSYYSNAEAQNRQGTHTATSYNKHLYAGNTRLSASTLAHATNKHWAKARKCWDVGYAPTGRVVRCCYAWLLGTESEYYDDLYYGHP